MADALATVYYMIICLSAYCCMCPHTAAVYYVLLYIAVSGGRGGGARRARNEVYVSAYAYCYIYVSAYYGISRYLEGVASMAGHEKKN
jgi:hypothetical protein